MLTLTLSHSHKQWEMIKKDCAQAQVTLPMYQLLPPLHTIAVGLGVGSSVRDMLRAYTTYFITVVAVSDILGTGRGSDPVEHTTIQRGICIYIIVYSCTHWFSMCADAAEAPNNVRATVEGSTVISVQWGNIPTCRLVNGLIVEYRVEYTANGRTQSTEEATDDPRSGAETTLTGLTPFTTYSIRVAGVNEEGDIGVYSDPSPNRLRKIVSVYSLLYIPLMPVIPTQLLVQWSSHHFPLSSK